MVGRGSGLPDAAREVAFTVFRNACANGSGRGVGWAEYLKAVWPLFF